MNKRQKEVIQYQLDSEKKVLDQLTKQYQKALNDIDRKIRILQSDELTQSRIYRIEHQKVLKKQVEAILEKLHADEYTTIQQFLSDSYTDAFVGTAYDLHGQGVPLILPVDRNAAVKAVTTDSKINEGLYESLGVDTKKLKKSISSEITRGIASGMPHTDIARNIARYAKVSLGRASTIVRTESHRIQQASKYDAQNAAKSTGANVVKQWNSTMDGDTRKSHRRLDGQIRELDEPFEMGGRKAMYPGDFGDPAEDCNCRCQILQRARIALDEDELKTLQERAKFFGLDKSDDLEDFKGKYLKAAERLAKDKKTIEISSNMTSDQIDSVGRRNIYGHWEEYREKFLGNASKVDFDNLDGFMYDTVKLGRYKDKEVVQKIFTQVDELSSKFYSPLQKMTWMDKTESAFGNAFATSNHMWGYGSAEIRFNPTKLAKEGLERIYELSQKGYSVRIPKGKEMEYLVTHEFGHCILNVGENLPSKAKNFVQCDFTAVKKARKEIEAIWDSYSSKVKELTDAHKAIADPLNSRMIFEGVLPTDEERKLMNDARKNLESVKISKYSLTNADEFIAEAFTDAVMGENPSEYSKKVYDVIVKYFGK